jgi:phosphatidylinositol alpha-mannosyltransferase
VLQRDYARRGTLTPGGVDLQQFAPTGSRAKEPTLLYCGALDERRKHVALLLEALALVAEREPSVRLQLCGPGDPSAVLASAPAVARERTELLPPVVPREAGAEELARRYSRAWATVLPATFEAFGMVLVESLACGTPIVAADHAALPELVTPATGALAAPLDAGSLADACACALELSGRPGVGEACRESAAPYDWRTSLAPRLETLYAGKGAG